MMHRIFETFMALIRDEYFQGFQNDIAQDIYNELVNGFLYKHENLLNAFPAKTFEIIKAFASQFERGGMEGLENPQIFQTLKVRQAGGLSALNVAGKPADLLRETKIMMFTA